MKEDRKKLKRTKRHYCAERKCSECEFVKGMPYECCFREITIEQEEYHA